jgi:hypothetical protein
MQEVLSLIEAGEQDAIEVHRPDPIFHLREPDRQLPPRIGQEQPFALDANGPGGGYLV